MRAARTIMNLTDLEEEAREFVSTLHPKQDSATLVTLSGNLGAGKTAFTQAVARTLGVTDTVTSPTFVLAKSYELSGTEFSKLVHIDAYRLTEGKDLKALDLAQTLKDAQTLVLLEWPEMVVDGLPQADVAITLTVRTDTERDIAYA
ncbi:MAG: tRNA (adenosine(37)-N6)-threonylcarbamoyltransferase complex ATPase subunit type 1 TsaE [bacterium]|nr:tRNA (adenosine(37)-N6)-threonylcarbamoyltransferase complex ATPase subunit type 1 TsaE [bacterium]